MGTKNLMGTNVGAVIIMLNITILSSKDVPMNRMNHKNAQQTWQLRMSLTVHLQ